MILIIRHRIAIPFRTVIKRRTSHTSALRNPRVGAEEGDTCVRCPLYLYLEGTHSRRMIRGRGERESTFRVKREKSAQSVECAQLWLWFFLFFFFFASSRLSARPCLSRMPARPRHLYFRKTVHPRTQIALRNDLSSRCSFKVDNNDERTSRRTPTGEIAMVADAWLCSCFAEESGCALGFVSGWRPPRGSSWKRAFRAKMAGFIICKIDELVSKANFTN